MVPARFLELARTYSVIDMIVTRSAIDSAHHYAALARNKSKNHFDKDFTTQIGQSAVDGALNWTTISSGAPEAGGGGASSAALTLNHTPVAAESGDLGTEPARRRKHTNGTAPVSGESLLRLRGVQARVPLSKSAIYKMIAESKFPEPIRLSARCSLWRASDIDAFVANLT